MGIRSFLLIVSLIFTAASYGQAEMPLRKPEFGKFIFSVEYMGALVGLREGGLQSRSVFGQNLQATLNYQVSPGVYVKSGLGFLEVGERIIGNVTTEIRYQETLSRYSYWHVPLGVSFISESYFFMPEIGIAFPFSARERYFAEDYDDNTITANTDIVLTEGEISPFTIPLMLTLGAFVHIAPDISITVGARVFTSANAVIRGTPRNSRYSGFGLVVGLAFR